MQCLHTRRALLLHVRDDALVLACGATAIIAEGQEDMLVEVLGRLGHQGTEKRYGHPDHRDALRRGVVHGLPAHQVGGARGLLIIGRIVFFFSLLLKWLVPILSHAAHVRPGRPSGPDAQGHGQAHEWPHGEPQEGLMLQSAAHPIGVLRHLLFTAEVGQLEILAEECLHDPLRGRQTVEGSRQCRDEDSDGQGQPEEEQKC
mmetsp:Transcript_71537/g.232488  ORF Transcript_71537/g.232488 Transcript_71537/m.232488 type:complete len:202 (-) Transcript_71537:2123-2728(-)